MSRQKNDIDREIKEVRRTAATSSASWKRSFSNRSKSAPLFTVEWELK